MHFLNLFCVSTLVFQPAPSKLNSEETRQKHFRVYPNHNSGQALDLLVSVRCIHYCTSTLTYQPIVCVGVLLPKNGKSYLTGSFLDAFSVYLVKLSYPAMPLAEQLVHQRFVHPGPLVLRTAPFKFPTPATDRDRTVSRRSEPSSRTALIGEQPNPRTEFSPRMR